MDAGNASAARSVRRRVAIGMVAAALVTGLAGCGDDDSEPSGGDPGSETEAEFSEYIGLETAAAGDLAEENGRPWRIVREDGEDLAVTMDHVENRLNFTVEDGTVVDVSTG